MNSRRLHFFICCGLALMCIIVFGQMLSHEFVRFDDKLYVSENPFIRDGSIPERIRWALTSNRAGFWIPLTWLSFIVDFEIFGLNPGGFLLTNLLLHTVNTLLLFQVLYQHTGARFRSALVAALFAIHPLHVESVAWVTERKDLLSTLWAFLALGAYGWHIRRPAVYRYILSILFFAFSLMAKPMLITLPFLLLLLDFWPFGRLQNLLIEGCGSAGRRCFNKGAFLSAVARLVKQKVPFFLVTGLFSAITIYCMQSATGLAAAKSLPFHARLANAVISYWVYIRKMVWPLDLAVFYPHPGWVYSIPGAVLAGVALLAVSVIVLFAYKKGPFLLVGWFWFLGTLLPVIGITQAGYQALADRFTYFPLIGLFIIVCWGGHAVFVERLRLQRWALAGSLGILLTTVCLCWVQAGYWKNALSLFTHSLAVTGPNNRMFNLMGLELLSKGRINEASVYFRKSLAINPKDPRAAYYLGVVAKQQQKTPEAIHFFHLALKLNKYSKDAMNGLGFIYTAKKEYAKATAWFKRALELFPDDPTAHNNMGAVLEHQGKYRSAVRYYAAALRLAPKYKQAQQNLARCATRLQKPLDTSGNNLIGRRAP